jgi:hypothetical protein
MFGLLAIAATAALVTNTYISNTIESNSICGQTYNPLPFFEDDLFFFTHVDFVDLAWIVIYALPTNGDLYHCQDVGTCKVLGAKVRLYEWFSVANDLTLAWRNQLIYIPYDNYYNRWEYSEYASNASLGYFQTTVDAKGNQLQNTDLDSFQFAGITVGFFFGFMDVNAIIQRNLIVNGRKSVPTITADSSVVVFARALATGYSDPDGDTYLTDFLFTSDNRGVSSTNAAVKCAGYQCSFQCLASDLVSMLDTIQFNASTTPFNRIQLSVVNKEVVRPSIVDAPCNGNIAPLATVVGYRTIQLAPVTYTPISKNYSIQDTTVKVVGAPARGNFTFNPPLLSYDQANPYSFSRSNGSVCSQGYSYDSIVIQTSFPIHEPNETCAYSVENTVDICTHDVERNPKVADVYVNNVVYLGGRVFIINVFDSNDDTIGEDDHLASLSSFHVNGAPTGSAGIVFAQTEFDGSYIALADCTGGPLSNDTIYNETAFCFFSTDAHGYEYTTFIAVDATGGESNVGLITFEPTPCVIPCSADETTGIDADGCTSTGYESNNLFGTTPIKIYMEILDYAPSTPIFWFIIQSLPQNGNLYRCGDPDCTIFEKKPVAIYDEILGSPGRHPTLVYIGNPDYFNFNLYDYSDYDWRGFGLSSPYAPGFTDRKDVPIGDCGGNVTDYGCPDYFRFSVFPVVCDASYSRYNIYVQNVGSNVNFQRSGTLYYAPGEEVFLNGTVVPGQPGSWQSYIDPTTVLNPLVLLFSLIPDQKFLFYKERDQWTYVDPDEDAWDVHLSTFTLLPSLGSTVTLDQVYFTLNPFYTTAATLGPNDDLAQCIGQFTFNGQTTSCTVSKTSCYDNGECQGAWEVVGLPSDVKDVLGSMYFRYFAVQIGNDPPPPPPGLPQTPTNPPSSGNVLFPYYDAVSRGFSNLPNNPPQEASVKGDIYFQMAKRFGGLGKPPHTIPLYLDYKKSPSLWDSNRENLVFVSPVVDIPYDTPSQFQNYKIRIPVPSDDSLILNILVDILGVLLDIASIFIGPEAFIGAALAQGLRGVTMALRFAAKVAINLGKGISRLIPVFRFLREGFLGLKSVIRGIARIPSKVRAFTRRVAFPTKVTPREHPPEERPGVPIKPPKEHPPGKPTKPDRPNERPPKQALKGVKAKKSERPAKPKRESERAKEKQRKKEERKKKKDEKKKKKDKKKKDRKKKDKFHPKKEAKKAIDKALKAIFRLRPDFLFTTAKVIAEGVWELLVALGALVTGTMHLTVCLCWRRQRRLGTM